MILNDSIAEIDSAWHGKQNPDVDVIERIARKHLQFAEEESCGIELYKSGRDYKHYFITKEGKAVGTFMVGRVDVGGLARNVFSTARWLQQKAMVPVHSVFSSDDTEKNELDYTWLINELPNWRPLELEDADSRTSWTGKKTVIESLAQRHAQLLEPRNRFSTIGEICLDTHSKTFYIGRVTKGHVRGPYSKSSEWLRAHLDGVIRSDSVALALAPSATPACDMRKVFVSNKKRLREKIPTFFFPGIDMVTETAFRNTSIRDGSIRLHEDGSFAGVENFEWSYAMPLWNCYQLPEGILGSERKVAPTSADPDYSHHRVAWEKTELRRIYLETIEGVHPGFKLRMKQYQRFNDFVYAALECWDDHDKGVYMIEEWLDAMDHGIYYSIRDRILGPWKACMGCSGSCDDVAEAYDSDETLPGLESQDEWEDEVEGDSEADEEDGYESAEEDLQDTMAE